MLERKCIGENFGMLMTDLRCWRSTLKIPSITKKSPTSDICHHPKVTNKTVVKGNTQVLKYYSDKDRNKDDDLLFSLVARHLWLQCNLGLNGLSFVLTKILFLFLWIFNFSSTFWPKIFESKSIFWYFSENRNKNGTNTNWRNSHLPRWNRIFF